MSDGAVRFSATAEAYAATMAPSLRPIAAEVVRRARLRPAERVLDIGTGTGTAAGMAQQAGARATGIDAAAGMLRIARRQLPEIDYRQMDFTALDFADGAFDVVLAVHSLLFADDQALALREWLRVTRPGGGLGLSVPGPTDATPTAIYRDIYARRGIDTSDRYPTPESLARLAGDAGWITVVVDADPETAIVLPDEAAFRTWREIGSRGPATRDYTAEQHRELTAEMIAVTPRTAKGGFRIPFGTIYLAARRARSPDG